MDHFAGLDVSVKETSVCILDDVGKIVKEVKVASEPQALLKVLGNPAYRFKQIGLEAGPLSQLRSRPEPSDALDTMVMAQGLGDAGRQASREKEGHRRPGATVSRDPAPHLG